MASDLDLHCLPMSHKKGARLWVKANIKNASSNAIQYGTFLSLKVFKAKIVPYCERKTKFFFRVKRNCVIVAPNAEKKTNNRYSPI